MRVRQLVSGRDPNLATRERQYMEQLDAKPVEGEIELF
jgi:hypothetical protein